MSSTLKSCSQSQSKDDVSFEWNAMNNKRSTSHDFMREKFTKPLHAPWNILILECSKSFQKLCKILVNSALSRSTFKVFKPINIISLALLSIYIVCTKLCILRGFSPSLAKFRVAKLSEANGCGHEGFMSEKSYQQVMLYSCISRMSFVVNVSFNICCENGNL